MKKILAIAFSAALALSMTSLAFAASPDEDNALVLDKNLVTTTDGYELVLEAYATGEEVDRPVDVIFVVDQSTSMFSTVNTDLTSKDGYSYEDFKANFLNTGANKALVAQEGYFVVRINDEARYFNATNSPDMSDYHATKSDYDTARKKSSFSTDIFHVIGKSTGNLRGSVTGYSNSDYTDGNADYIWLPVRWNSSKNQLEYNVTVLECREEEDKNYGQIGGVEYHVGDNYWLPFPANAESISASNMRFYKTIYGASYDAMMIFYEKTKDLDNVRVAIAGFSEGGGIFGATKKNAYVEDIDLYDDELSQAQADDLTSFLKSKKGSTYGSSAFAAAGSADLLARIKNINPNYYGTVTDAGLALANYIFKNSSVTGAKSDAARYVILYTDGDPVGNLVDEYESGGNSDSTEPIKQANRLKNTYGATVYAITPPSAVSKTYLSCISSEYPNATSTSSKGTKNPDDKEYAIAATSSAELTEAFTNLSETISQTAVTLGSKTVMKDIITPYFTLPQDLIRQFEGKTQAQKNALLAAEVKVSTADYDGKTFGAETPLAGATISFASSDYSTVDVSGFDYAANYISAIGRNGFYGKKLVVRIPIETRPDFLGGDDVATNGAASGIYSGSNLVDSFPIPKPDIKVKPVEPQIKNGYIYLSQAAELPHVANVGEFAVAGVYEEDGVTPKIFKVDGINNAYVNITYTISVDGKKIAYTLPAGTKYGDIEETWTGDLKKNPVLHGDKAYTVTCDVVSKSNAGNASQTVGTSTIYVYTPVITFEDSEIELGNSAKYYVDNDSEVDNYVSVKWVDANGATPTTEAQKKLGVAPELEYAYSPAEAAFPDDTEVKVTSVVSPKRVLNKDNAFNHAVPNDFDLLEAGGVTFYRDACDACGHEAGEVADGGINFVVHIKRADLVVEKKGIEVGLDEGQSTIFEVAFADQSVAGAPSLEVVVQGNGSVVIKDLPVGTYVVTEKTDWSWRYVLESVSVAGADGSAIDSQLVNASCTFGLPKGGATVTFENDRKDIYWLDGNCWCKNIFKKVASTDAPSAN